MYKAAIIGTGNIARAHVAGLRAHGDRVDLVAAMDLDSDRARMFCDEHDIPRHYEDVDALLAEVKPDLVHICAPPATHKSLIIKCMEAGAWVLCEKPLVGSLAEFDQLTAAEERTGQYVASVFQMRFGPATRHLHNLIADDVLGQHLVGICQTTWYRDEDYYAAPWRGTWEKETGGTTMTHGIHTIDMMLSVLGDWCEVRAMMATLDRDIEVDNVLMGTIQMANGALVSVINSALSPHQETYVRMDFQKASVEARYLYGYTNDDWTFTLLDENAPGMDRVLPIPGDDTSHWYELVQTMLDSLDAGQRPPISGESVRRTIEICAALYKASFTGQPVQPGTINADDPFYYAMNGKQEVN